MKLATLFKTSHPWLKPSGAEDPIILGTLGRLTRALSGQVFPGWSTVESRRAAAEQLRPQIMSIKGFKTAFHADMEQLSHHERRLLLERKLISPSMAARGAGSEIIIPKRQDICIMLNEEEHLVMHAFSASRSLTDVRLSLEQVANQLEDKLSFAQSAAGDYLSSIPVECGNGLQLYQVVYLPGLVISNLMKEMEKAIEKLGLQMSPYYSDGQKDTADCFVIYTTPCGQMQFTHESLKLERVINTLERRERQVRRKLIHLRPLELRDQVTRALGRLQYATTLSFSEMSNAISLLILGVSYDIIDSRPSAEWVDEKGGLVPSLRQFNINYAPAHLAQRLSLSCGEQDSREMKALRAQLLQRDLRELNLIVKPIILSLSQNQKYE